MERDGGGTERQRGEGLRRSLSRAWVVGMVAEQAKGASTAGTAAGTSGLGASLVVDGLLAAPDALGLIVGA